jgi:hypothetical protein
MIHFHLRWSFQTRIPTLSHNIENGTYSKIDTTKFSSLLSFERESIDSHQANDEQEGVEEHLRGVVMCKERVVKSGDIASRSTTVNK